MLWLRSLESAQAQPLAGTEGATGTVIWSPEGDWIGFFADGRLKRIRPDGEPPETIAELRGFQEADWGSQGDILFRPRNREPLYVIHETGGSPRQVTQLDVELTENSHRGPEFLPDGRRFLFTSRCAERANNALSVASFDSPEVRRLMPAEAAVSYVPSRAERPESLFYYREGALFARPFDADREAFNGEPTLVTEEVHYVAPSIAAGFRVSGDGSVIVVRPAGGDEAQLTWFRRDGEAVGSVGPRGRPGQPRISPNGEAVLFTAPDPQSGNRDVWHTELARGITTRVTTHIANDWHPVWSPDGRQILFWSDRGAGGSIYLKTSLDPGAGEEPIPELRGVPQDWSRDGRWISYFRGQDVWVGSLSDVVEAFPFLETSTWESNLRFSPDGRWVAMPPTRRASGRCTCARLMVDLPVRGGGFSCLLTEAIFRYGGRTAGSSSICPGTTSCTPWTPRTSDGRGGSPYPLVCFKCVRMEDPTFCQPPGSRTPPRTTRAMESSSLSVAARNRSASFSCCWTGCRGAEGPRPGRLTAPSSTAQPPRPRNHLRQKKSTPEKH